MKKISIDELPKHTPWVGRLLRLEPFSRPVRDLAKIDAEYDKNKYARLLAEYNRGNNPGMTDVRRMDAYTDSDTVCISRKGKLFLAPVGDIGTMTDDLLVDALADAVGEVRVIVELGCGYGYNLSVLDKAYPERIWLGGEYSPNAVRLAGHLFAGKDNINVLPFNYYDKTWGILESLEEKALVFTRHSIEQLPLAGEIIATLAGYRQKIAQVIHLEPVYELADKSSALGLMRRAYTLINDYNTDLLTVLEDMKMQILETDADLLGTNPLNPTCLIRWKIPE